jgi:hypothetical protein
MYSVWNTSTHSCCGVTFHETLLFIFSHSVGNLSALVDGKWLATSASLFTIGVAIYVTTRYVNAGAYRDEIALWGT